jgi:hypothetical protein
MLIPVKDTEYISCKMSCRSIKTKSVGGTYIKRHIACIVWDRPSNLFQGTDNEIWGS